MEIAFFFFLFFLSSPKEDGDTETCMPRRSGTNVKRTPGIAGAKIKKGHRNWKRESQKNNVVKHSLKFSWNTW